MALRQVADWSVAEVLLFCACPQLLQLARARSRATVRGNKSPRAVSTIVYPLSRPNKFNRAAAHKVELLGTSSRDTGVRVHPSKSPSCSEGRGFRES
jgi:hypothetical protein